MIGELIAFQSLPDSLCGHTAIREQTSGLEIGKETIAPNQLEEKTFANLNVAHISPIIKIYFRSSHILFLISMLGYCCQKSALEKEPGPAPDGVKKRAEHWFAPLRLSLTNKWLIADHRRG